MSTESHRSHTICSCICTDKLIASSGVCTNASKMRVLTEKRRRNTKKVKKNEKEYRSPDKTCVDKHLPPCDNFETTQSDLYTVRRKGASSEGPSSVLLQL